MGQDGSLTLQEDYRCPCAAASALIRSALGDAFRFLLADPRVPRFAVGGVLAGEGDGSDIGVGDHARVVAVLDENFDPGGHSLGSRLKCSLQPLRCARVRVTSPR